MVVIVIILSNNFYWSILDLQCCANFSCTANIYRLFFFFFFNLCKSLQSIEQGSLCLQQVLISYLFYIQYSCLENPMDGGAWQAAVHGVAKSWTRLSNFTFTFDFHELEKEMAIHSSVLACRIPGTGEPGGLPSMGLHRVGCD